MRKLILMAVAATAFAAPAFAAPVSGEMIAQITKADANGDKQVTREELLTYRATQFTKMDRNKDGALSTADRARAPRAAANPAQIEALIAEFDKDGDGKVSKDEFVNGPTPAFDAADADKNDIVTQAEAQTAMAAAKANVKAKAAAKVPAQ